MFNGPHFSQGKMQDINVVPNVKGNGEGAALLVVRALRGTPKREF